VSFRHQDVVVATALLLALLFLPQHAAKAEDPPANLVLVTLDGVRWQEVFGGIDLDLIEDERYTNSPELLKDTYWREQRDERRKLLFPFLWSVVASQGVLVGDREQESFISVSNPWWFSYPGYNEILTGSADPAIDSNARNWNRNVTFLEILNGIEGFKNQVLAFGSWDVFPYIINTRRSGVPVNSGFTIASPATSAKSRWLNEISVEAPMLWHTVRLDLLTNGYAMEALENQHPRVIYIAYGETDDFAHDGSYDRYIDAAHRTDLMLSKLWNWLQSDSFYRDRTTLVISTDHGRGDTPDGWTRHASAVGAVKLEMGDAPDGVPGSDQIWFAAIGPRIQSKGLVTGHWKQSQIAATALASLQLDAANLMPQADSAMDELLHAFKNMGTTMDAAELEDFAQRYTAAWCSRNAASVAAFFAEDGSITVNGAPSIGREAITDMAQGFMTAFPDLQLTMDDLEIRPEQVIYRWTFVGTNTGPEGTGKPVRFSGYEEWTFGNDGLVMKSSGHFDNDEYQYQLEHGVE